MEIILEALMNLKKVKFKEIRTYLNDNIKNITTETELRKLMDKLNKYEWDLENINNEIKIVEKKLETENNT